MTYVKICGVSDPNYARVAAAYGADFVGVVTAPDPAAKVRELSG